MGYAELQRLYDDFYNDTFPRAKRLMKDGAAYDCVYNVSGWWITEYVMGYAIFNNGDITHVLTHVNDGEGFSMCILMDVNDRNNTACMQCENPYCKYTSQLKMAASRACDDITNLLHKMRNILNAMEYDTLCIEEDIVHHHTKCRYESDNDLLENAKVIAVTYTPDEGCMPRRYQPFRSTLPIVYAHLHFAGVSYTATVESPPIRKGECKTEDASIQEFKLKTNDLIGKYIWYDYNIYTLRYSDLPFITAIDKAEARVYDSEDIFTNIALLCKYNSNVIVKLRSIFFMRGIRSFQRLWRRWWYEPNDDGYVRFASRMYDVDITRARVDDAK